MAFLKNNLIKLDYLSFALIVLFSIYAYFGSGFLKIPSNDENNYLLNILLGISALVVITYLFLLLKYTHDNQVNYGFRLFNKEVWASLGIIIILAVIGFDIDKQILTADRAIQILKIAIYFVCSEFILRVLPTELIKKLFNDKYLVHIALLLNGIIFIVIQKSFYPITFGIIISSIYLSYLYFYWKTILLSIFIDIFMIVGRTQAKENTLLIDLVTIIIYFAIAIPVKILQTKNKVKAETMKLAVKS